MGKGARTRSQRIRRMLILKRQRARSAAVDHPMVPAPVQVMRQVDEVMSPQPTDYSVMSRDDLRKVAADKNIKGRSKMTKAELVAALETS